MARFFYALLCITACLIGGASSAAGQGPTKQWDKTYGGSLDETLRQGQQTSDGGYIFGGTSHSGISGDKTQANQAEDYWVIKVDSNGIKQWDYTFGGNSSDMLTVVKQTSDGGYILGGYSASDSSGTKTQASRGGNDFWLIKLADNGGVKWDRTYGGQVQDILLDLQPTNDGGYLLGGYSDSGISGDKTEPSRGFNDYWVVKVDANGNKQWDRTFGGSYEDVLTSVQQTLDGGYILGGGSWSNSSGERTQPSQGEQDYWIVKLDASGNKQWDKAYGGGRSTTGDGSESLTALELTSDGGYILGGFSPCGIGGDKTQASLGLTDYWLIKVDASGTKQWDRTFGGAYYDEMTSLLRTPDGGYLLGGHSNSPVSAYKTEASRGQDDYWMVKVDSSGTKQWDRTFGGSDMEKMVDLQPTRDGGHILAGISSSGISGDKTQASRGRQDFWVVKLGPAPAPLPVVTITGDSVVCVGVVGQLTAVGSSPVNSYRWSTGATTASIAVSQGGRYSVQVTFAGGLLATASYQVRVRPLPCASSPWVTITGDSVLCQGTPGQLTAVASSTTVSSYRWNTGASTAGIVIHQSGTYSVQVAYPGGLLATASYQVRVASCATALPRLLIPNVVTPNGDGRNDRFRIQGLTGTGWQLQVYNRWGRQVYQSHNYHHEWGADAAAGLYYFVLQGPTAYKGWLEVIR